jgi:hypothetical protein
VGIGLLGYMTQQLQPVQNHVSLMYINLLKTKR